jgi:hypothetical protein
MPLERELEIARKFFWGPAGGLLRDGNAAHNWHAGKMVSKLGYAGMVAPKIRCRSGM